MQSLAKVVAAALETIDEPTEEQCTYNRAIDDALRVAELYVNQPKWVLEKIEALKVKGG